MPPLALAALGWLARGSRPPLAALAPLLFALAWAAKGTLGGEVAALALSALACVTLGWLLASAVEPRWLALGLYALAILDALLIGAELLQGPNATINAAAPGAGLPQLHFVDFGSARMGFADLFVAAVLGAMLARDRALQLLGAAIAAAIGIGFDSLFFTLDQLPATVPIALALAALQLTGRLRAAWPAS